jgi:hypothetical protein
VHPQRLSRCPWLARLNALLLLAVFLVSGTSLPSADALIYHGVEAEAGKWQSHLEPAGGCLNHAEHCGLGRTAPGSGSMVVIGSALRVKPPQETARPATPAPPESNSASAVTPPSRAPPAPSA